MTALEIGMNESEFWESSPFVFFMKIRAWIKNQSMEFNSRAMAAAAAQGARNIKFNPSDYLSIYENSKQGVILITEEQLTSIESAFEGF